MSNLEKYRDAFVKAFEADPEEVSSYVFHKTEAWNSVGHLSLIAALEDAFDIEFEPEDILSLTSYEIGMDVLRSKDIEF